MSLKEMRRLFTCQSQLESEFPRLVSQVGFSNTNAAQRERCRAIIHSFYKHLTSPSYISCAEEVQDTHLRCTKVKLHRESTISQGLRLLSWTSHRWTRNHPARMLSRRPIGQSYTELMNLSGRTYPLGWSPHHLALKGLWYPACHLMRCTEWYD